MHIGLDGLPLTAAKTGVGHYTYELARALASTDPTGQFEFVYPSNAKSVVAELSSGPFPSNLKLTRVQVGPLGSHWWSVGLPRYLRRNKLELFHGTNYDIPLWRRCATVLTIHDLSQLLHPETHEKRSVGRARRRLPYMARLADAIITPTQCVRADVCEVLKVSPEKVFTIPEAARDCFRPLDSAKCADVRRRFEIGEDFLLTVGTLEPRKNLSVLISAFEVLTRTGTQDHIQLVIAGGQGWLSTSLFETITKSPVRERIILTGYLDDDDLQALYSSCLAFIYPSIDEGFGLPPLEAMACGAPVMVSRIAALEETSGGAALMFDPKSPSRLAQKISELIANEDARRELSSAGQRHAARFSWEKTARKTLEVYEKVLSVKSRRDS